MDAVYWDTRDLRGELPVEPALFDVRVLYGWDSDLASLVRKVQPDGMGEFLDLDRRASAHLRAAQEGKVDPEIPSRKLIPDDIFRSYANAREHMASVLFTMKDQTERDRYVKHVYPLLRSVRHIERNGIHVDVLKLRELMKRKDLAVHETSFLRSTSDLLRDGDLVYSKISPVGTRTGRMTVEGGFKCMNVPHGVCRQVVNSRFPGGKIVTLDFNAIDYRCLVKSLGDDRLKAFYQGERDFHSKTARIFDDVTPTFRDIIKKVTYTHLYGGSRQTLQKQTLLPMKDLESMLNTLDDLFRSITEGRERMAAEAKRSGFVFTPNGVPVKVEPDDHDGKIIGLFAQSYASEVFNKALDCVVRELVEQTWFKSRVIFTVHDEIVIDMHPDEGREVSAFQEIIELVTGFVVKLKEGENYGEATDG